MKKTSKIITAFLGIAMFMFGVLKFVDPFKTWYHTQVEKSELPFQAFSYWSGQLGEIAVGMMLLLSLWPTVNQQPAYRQRLRLLANILVIIMMATAFYVHMHPGVPESVLPLKIRPPFIPGFFLVLAMWNIYLDNQTGKGK